MTVIDKIIRKIRFIRGIHVKSQPHPLHLRHPR
jgi:hypothetical protein